MKKKAAVEERKQGKTTQAVAVAMQQLMLPLLVAADATKKGLLAFVQHMGMIALSELLESEAEMIAGPKGRHLPDRTHHHWGSDDDASVRRSSRGRATAARSAQGRRRSRIAVDRSISRS